MNQSLFQKLQQEGLLSSSSIEKITVQEQTKIISLHWELRTILYLGILLLTAGLGILVYKNIDTIGHQAILLFIAMISAGSFFYCFKNKLPFSRRRVEAPNAFFDYILLLACLTFISFIAYVQFRYNIFGHRYGLATFIPLTVLFFTAYYFDHLGILSLAITNLAAWLGLTVTPLHIIQSNNFANSNLILTGVLFGVALVLAGMLHTQRDLKPHFRFTYINFGLHILFISLVGGMLYYESLYLVWFAALCAIAVLFYFVAKKDKSFYLLLVSTLYFYAALNYVVINLLGSLLADTTLYLGFLYFIGSAVALVIFLMRANKILKHDSIQ